MKISMTWSYTIKHKKKKISVLQCTSCRKTIFNTKSRLLKKTTKTLTLNACIFPRYVDNNEKQLRLAYCLSVNIL